MESSEEQTTDRPVLFSNATIYPPGARQLMLYLDSDDLTEIGALRGTVPFLVL